ncbi:MAG: hypothetical protein ACLP3C_21575 [Mycobacterium sp.]
MTATEMATYAYNQIDQARAELNAVSKWTGYESLESSYQDQKFRTARQYR